MKGYSGNYSTAREIILGKAVTPWAWFSSEKDDTNGATLIKTYDGKDGKTVFLQGCVFKLVEYEIVSGKAVERKTVEENITTGEDGKATIKGMQSGKLYGLVETAVPKGGFTVKNEPLYFSFGIDNNIFPSEYDVYYINSGGILFFENDPPKTEEESSGESSEDTSPSDEESSSGDTKPSEEGSPSQDTKPSGTEETTNKRGDVEGEGDTTSGVPKDPEKETGGSQTETSTEDEGKTDPDNDRNGDLEGEGNLVNTSDRPYIKVILIFLILGVIAAAVTEATMLWRSDEEN